MRQTWLLLTIALQVCNQTQAQHPVQQYNFKSDTLEYPKPKHFEYITKLPPTFAEAGKLTWRKETLLPFALITASTLVILPFDQDILEATNRFSSFVHVDPERKYRTLIGFDLGDTEVKVYEAPQNFNSVLYTLGEGSTSMLISGGLYLYGKIGKDYRAGQAASDIVRAQIAVGLVTQLLKRISGRQSPFVSTQDGGKWSPLTSPATYQKHVPNYDAFPSGHLASMMATVTVLALHYPEKKWIKPVGYALMTLVSTAMINNGVHWATDYPLALGIGYLFGKATVANYALPRN
ncbi:MAG: phosphatase PAP2 family protein [Cyclobacteriaceae bacterium]|nr:phosphatase PAP2 family protein [Cyclobacteriaceae bacterium]